MKTHQDLIKITRCMELLSDLDCSQMAEKVKASFSTHFGVHFNRFQISLSVELYVWCQDSSFGPSLSDMTQIDWLAKATLNQLVEDCFQASS